MIEYLKLHPKTASFVAFGLYLLMEYTPESYFKRVFIPENAPNIALVFVGIAGILVALLTLKNIERQTKSTEDAAIATQNSAMAMLESVELQEIQYSQWVEIVEWENMSGQPFHTVNDSTIVIRFKIKNTTKFPLTL